MHGRADRGGVPPEAGEGRWQAALHRTERARLTWGAAVLGLVIFTLGGAASLNLLVFHHDARARERAALNLELDRTLVAVSRRVRQAEEEIRREAASLVATQALPEAVARRDAHAVRSALLASDRAPGWDLLFVTDYLGRFLAGNGPVPGARSLLSSAGVEAAVAGEPREVFWVVEGTAYEVHLLPLAHGERLVGALGVGRRIDAPFLDALRGRHSTQLTVGSGDQVLARTSLLPGLSPAPSFGAVHRLGRLDGGGDLELRILPLQGPGTAALLPWDKLIATSALWLLVSLALALVAVRRQRAALGGLEAAAERVQLGDLVSAVPRSGFDEEHRLGEAMERMRRGLLDRRDEALQGREGLQRALDAAQAGIRQLQHELDRTRQERDEARRRADSGVAVSELRHEIRTPAATLHSAISGSAHALVEVLRGLYRIEASPLSDDSRSLLVSAMEDAASSPEPENTAPGAEDALADDLHVAGVIEWERAARVILQGRLRHWAKRLMPLLRGEARGEVLGVLDTFARLQVYLHSGATASRAISRLVRASTSPDDPAEEAGRLLDVRQGLEDALALLQHEMRDRIRVIRSIPILPPVRGDQGALCQVWTNLIHNAVQAMCPAGGTLSLQARPEGGWVTVGVRDTGPGIAPHLRPQIFEPGVSTKLGRGGTGVGLAIARRIVEGHGGRISVDSTDGGTCFEVRLPAAQARQEEGA